MGLGQEPDQTVEVKIYNDRITLCTAFKKSVYPSLKLKFVFLEIVCDNIAPFKNGNMYRLSQDSWKQILKTGAILQVGDRVIYECEEGFTRDGQAEVECLKDGTLSQEQPICQPITCSMAPM